MWVILEPGSRSAIRSKFIGFKVYAAKKIDANSMSRVMVILICNVDENLGFDNL